jgi:hypothetical protein
MRRCEGDHLKGTFGEQSNGPHPLTTVAYSSYFAHFITPVFKKLHHQPYCVSSIMSSCIVAPYVSFLDHFVTHEVTFKFQATLFSCVPMSLVWFFLMNHRLVKVE